MIQLALVLRGNEQVLGELRAVRDGLRELKELAGRASEKINGPEKAYKSTYMGEMGHDVVEKNRPDIGKVMWLANSHGADVMSAGRGTVYLPVFWPESGNGLP